MFKIVKVKVSGFWGRYEAESDFINGVNVIIGKNGTGKTTFMNILECVLTVNVEGLLGLEFDYVEVFLVDFENKKKKKISVSRVEGGNIPVEIFEYQVSNKKHQIRGVSIQDRGFAQPIRRRVAEEANSLRKEMAKFVSVSSISVYRLRNDDDFEIRDRHGLRTISPVDYRLDELMQALTTYQLSLSDQAREIGAKLQRKVLGSILYGPEDAQEKGYDIQFNSATEQDKLVSAYKTLGAFDGDIDNKIKFHVGAIQEALEKLERFSLKIKSGAPMPSESDEPLGDLDFRSLEALRKSRRIVDMSLEAEESTKELYSRLDLFLETLRYFIEGKEFKFVGGKLSIYNKHNAISHDKLSSGEKQLLILLIEALLQEQKPHVFLADEPELSLHVEWQRKVIPAVVTLNPNAQVIVATHSPEVASEYSETILDMQEIVHEHG